MRERPDISVVVPVYNAADYLRECVDSILGQRNFDGTIEVLLVDDGSTDGSACICREYAAAHDNVTLIDRGHGGVSHARNLGIDAARGRYIAFVDSDDTILPNFAAVMSDAAGNADIVCCGSFRRPCVSRPDHLPEVGVRHYDAHTAVMWMLYQRHGIDCSPCGKLFRREVIADERFRVGRRYEDLEWTPRVMLRAVRGVKVVDHAFYYYRVTPGSFINTVDRSRLDVLDMVTEVERRMVAAGDSRLLAAARERSFSAHYNMMILLGKDPDVARRCWQVICHERMRSLFGRRTRMKSRAGALLSLTGRRFVMWLTGRLKRL